MKKAPTNVSNALHAPYAKTSAPSHPCGSLAQQRAQARAAVGFGARWPGPRRYHDRDHRHVRHYNDRIDHDPGQCVRAGDVADRPRPALRRERSYASKPAEAEDGERKPHQHVHGKEQRERGARPTAAPATIASADPTRRSRRTPSTSMRPTIASEAMMATPAATERA